MAEGIIYKALSGFYTVKSGESLVTCRARGKFRHVGESPLVGDRVIFDPQGGVVQEILPRRNLFSRPPVANLDQLVVIASQAIPITDPYLIDKMTAIAEHHGVEPVIVVNKTDLAEGERLRALYAGIGFHALATSAETGAGIEALRELLRGKVSALTGNSGVGKSSLLNALQPGLSLSVNAVSEKLGRGKHTTRHVELFDTDFGAVIADTPGFSSFDTESAELKDPALLAPAFREFRPYLEACRFIGCAHVREKGCAVREAVQSGLIPASRHQSYVRLYEHLKEAYRAWENH